MFLLKTKIVLFCFILFFINTAFHAQTEIEIKTSNEYYWGQSIDDTEQAARSYAREELIFNITKDLPDSPALSRDSDIFLDGIKYLSFPRGPKIRVVAYIAKSQVNNIGALKHIEIIVKEDTTQIAESSQKSEDEKFEDKEKDKVTQNQKESINCKEYVNLMKCILQAEVITQVYESLANLKGLGKVNFSNFTNTMLQFENTYFIVFDQFTGSIIAVLDKGKTANRINLKTNTFINNFPEFYKQNKIIWLQVY